jgi:hypothetical protein
MAFVTTFISTRSPGETSNAYNIDFSMGPGARGNLPEDIMLVQALFRIVHFEVSNPVAPPPGETGIGVDGQLGPRTIRFILNFQRIAKAANLNVVLDGIFDPFRAQGELSSVSRTQYAMEVLNHTAFGLCRKDGTENYIALPARDDIPPVLAGALAGPQRNVARKYEQALVH